MKRHLVLLFTLTLGLNSFAEKQPNILWIITDDHRADSISYYNEAVSGQKESALGYVESPNIDKLASEGILFTQAFCNAPACGPSRGSMHSGRYPFRNGHYAFELTHQAADFVKPTISQTLRDSGYGTAAFGKDDHYIYAYDPDAAFVDAGLFDERFHFKHHLQSNGLGDLYVSYGYTNINGRTEKAGMTENVVYPDGTKRTYYLKRSKGELTDADRAGREQTNKEFDLLRAHTRYNTDLIIGGVNPLPAEDTVDANIVKTFKNYLANADREYKSIFGRTQKGVDSNKPVFLQLGFHLPHTPVIPPASVRERFKTKSYKVPAFDKKDEFGKWPEQIQRLYGAMKIEGMSDDEVQQAIQDYYAFCAYGDELIGDAVEAFKAYCKKQNEEYLILFAVGDHGWHLGEQGTMAKFGPWIKSTAGATIMVSSDKSLTKPGSVYSDLIEYVDFAPTFMAAGGVDYQSADFDYLDGYNLFDVVNEKVEKRDYILGEMNLVCGPRAYLHTERFRFSMRTRKFDNIVNENQLGKDVDWALTAPLDQVDLTLYDLESDPDERNNLAYSEGYKQLAEWFRAKLGNIVLGDGRIEADWSQKNTYHISNFAQGADDKKADVPAELIP